MRQHFSYYIYIYFACKSFYLLQIISLLLRHFTTKCMLNIYENIALPLHIAFGETGHIHSLLQRYTRECERAYSS